MERFLYRLSISPHAEAFVLKGALLFRVWNTPDTRATRDIDFLAYLDNAPDTLAGVVQDICSVDCPEDGLVFDRTSVVPQRIKEDADYEGVRIRFRGHLGNAIVTLQVDVGFGDTVHPAVLLINYPTILDLPAPRLRGYPPETVIAEKTEAMLHLGRLNSRMKDFYDVWQLAQHMSFDGAVLSEALRGTLERRRTEIVDFDELRAEILENPHIETQWRAFLRKSQLAAPEVFAYILVPIGTLLAPILFALKQGHHKSGTWHPAGPWHPK